jgi:hypothetical protein
MSEDKRAIEIIQEYDREEQKDCNFRNLWQEAADLEFPRENQITTTRSPGEDKSVTVYDSTAIFDSQDATSGLSSALFPAGTEAFALMPDDEELAESEIAQRYCSMATHRVHTAIMASNFSLHWNEAIRSLLVFGNCNLFEEWDNERLGLNFKDFDISLYTVKQDHRGNIDTVYVKPCFTARQAVAKFGNRAGEVVVRASKESKSESDKFDFINCVRPRKNRNPQYEDGKNKKFESVWINVKEKVIVYEGGYEELPYFCARWMKSSHEKRGRGQGTECLADVRMLQQMHKDFINAANVWADPPLIVHTNFEGRVRVMPHAVNRVTDMSHIAALDQRAMGNIPITKEIIEFQQDKIHRAFFRDLLAPIGPLTGDRRTQMEIQQRIEESLQRLAAPIARVQSELMDPMVIRSYWLLVRNGRIPPPPPELRGMRIEYLGRLALQLRNQEAQAFQRVINIAGQMDQLFPGSIKPSDNFSIDRGTRRFARAQGLNEEDLATVEERDAVRQQRAQDIQQQKMAMAAQVAGAAYKDTSGAPEEGSPAQMAVAGMVK